MSDDGPSVLPLNPYQSEQSNQSLCQAPENTTMIENITGRRKTPVTLKEKELTSNIENGNEVKFYFSKLLILDHSLLMFCVMNLIITIIYVDSDYYTAGTTQATSQVCLYCLLVVGALCTVFVFIRYQVYVNLQISRFQLSKQDSLWSSDNIVPLVFDLLIILIQPYPFLNDILCQTLNVRDNYLYQFKLNYFLALGCFFKIFIIGRIMLGRTRYMTPQANRVCKMYAAENGYLYAIKGLFMDSPMMLIGVTFLLSILIFALTVRICERELTRLDKIHGVPSTMDLQDLTNVIWFTIITMTTVGYGDIYPRSLTGRIIVVVLIVWGSVIVSLIIVVLTNSLTMVMSERRALTVLNRLDLKSRERDVAVSLIASTYRYRRVKKLKQPKTQLAKQKKAELLSQYELKINNYSKQMRQIKQNMQSTLEFDDLYQQLTRQFDSFMIEVDNFIDNQKKVEEDLDKFLERHEAIVEVDESDQ